MGNDDAYGYLTIDHRHNKMQQGIAKLRTHLPPNSPLKFTMVFTHEHRRWEVLSQFIPEGVVPLLLSREDLDVFPSDALIAQAMLVA